MCLVFLHKHRKKYHQSLSIAHTTRFFLFKLGVGTDTFTPDEGMEGELCTFTHKGKGKAVEG